MKVPLFEKLTPTSFAPEALESAFKEAQAGAIPLYLELGASDLKLGLDMLDAISQAFLKIAQNKQLPYPLYVITNLVDRYDGLAIIPSTRELPDHFNKRSKRLRPKEEALLRKTEMLARKVKNLDINQGLEVLQKDRQHSRELSDLTREAYFYEEIAKKLGF